MKLASILVATVVLIGQGSALRPDPPRKDIVYADSLNAVSSPEFRFTGDAHHPSIVDLFRRSIATVAALPCDILVTVHPVWQANGALDAGSCRAYATGAARRLDARVASERGSKR